MWRLTDCFADRRWIICFCWSVWNLIGVLTSVVVGYSYFSGRCFNSAKVSLQFPAAKNIACTDSESHHSVSPKEAGPSEAKPHEAKREERNQPGRSDLWSKSYRSIVYRPHRIFHFNLKCSSTLKWRNNVCTTRTGQLWMPDCQNLRLDLHNHDRNVPTHRSKTKTTSNHRSDYANRTAMSNQQSKSKRGCRFDHIFQRTAIDMKLCQIYQNIKF